MPPWVAFGWGVVVHGLGLHRAPTLEQVIHTVGGVVRAK